MQVSFEFFSALVNFRIFLKNALDLFFQWTKTTEKPCSKHCTEDRKTVCLYHEDVPQCYADCLKKVSLNIFQEIRIDLNFG